MPPELLAVLEASAARMLPADGSGDHRFGEHFYRTLFAQAPGVRVLFPDDLRAQQRKLAAMLRVTVVCARDPDALLSTLAGLGARHVGYGTRPEHYPAVEDALVRTLVEVGGAGGQEVEAWRRAYALIAGVMREVGQLEAKPGR